MERQIQSFEFESLGVEHPQYFRGVSTIFTVWDAAYIGMGNTEYEAADDAIEMFAQSGEYDDGAILNMEHAIASFDNDATACDCDTDDCELQFYVALWVK